MVSAQVCDPIRSIGTKILPIRIQNKPSLRSCGGSQTWTLQRFYGALESSRLSVTLGRVQFPTVPRYLAHLVHELDVVQPLTEEDSSAVSCQELGSDAVAVASVGTLSMDPFSFEIPFTK